MSTEPWLNPPLSDSSPPSILVRADALAAKTAFLAGMLAPEVTACLSRVLMATSAYYSSLIEGHDIGPEDLEHPLAHENLQCTHDTVTELRRRIIAALTQHYRLLLIRPLIEGNGTPARMSIHLQLAQLGLRPHLWSLSRGLARRQDEYLTALAMTDRTRDSELNGSVQLSGKASFTFVEFMLDVCHEEVDYMTAALNRRKLRESVTHAFRTHSRLQEKGIRPETGPAFLALLIQGALARAEFETFTGLQRETASDQLSRLINLGLVVSSPSNLHMLEVDLPVWFAQEILLDLHKRW